MKKTDRLSWKRQDCQESVDPEHGETIIETLPAIQWKLANILKVGAEKRAELLDKLKRTLEV